MIENWRPLYLNKTLRGAQRCILSDCPLSLAMTLSLSCTVFPGDTRDTIDGEETWPCRADALPGRGYVVLTCTAVGAFRPRLANHLISAPELRHRCSRAMPIASVFRLSIGWPHSRPAIWSNGGVVPVIAVGSFADGATAFILPLAIDRNHAARRLCWFGQEQSDYNAPLLASDFSRRVTADDFLAVWRELRERMQHDPQWRHDWIELERADRRRPVNFPPRFRCQYTPPARGPTGSSATAGETFYYAKAVLAVATRRCDRAASVRYVRTWRGSLRHQRRRR